MCIDLFSMEISAIFFFSSFLCSYKSLMRLNITDVRAEDFGEYECVSKNDINTTAATFHVYGDLNIHTHTKKNLICLPFQFQFKWHDINQIEWGKKNEIIYDFVILYGNFCRWCTSSNAYIFRSCSIWNATTQINII